jgi:DNA processing protein
VLSQHGFTIVSGLAAGIDAEAHRACLQAGGKTIAVLGTGVDVPYPRQNLKLYEQLCDRGLIVSDYPPGTPPNSQNFPPRNRIIAGLSRAVLVMEGAEKSGAMITARYANEFNRDVYVLPGSLDNPQALGCLALCNQGAQIILGTRSLLETLGEIPQLDQADAPAAKSPPPDLAPHLLQVWSAIAPEPTSFDRIAATCGQSSGQVSGALLQLELMGLVTTLPGLQYRRS